MASFKARPTSISRRPISSIRIRIFRPMPPAESSGPIRIRSIPAGREFRSDRKSTRLNSSHSQISYAVFCLKKKKQKNHIRTSQYLDDRMGQREGATMTLLTPVRLGHAGLLARVLNDKDILDMISGHHIHDN